MEGLLMLKNLSGVKLMKKILHKPCIYCGEIIEFDEYDLRYGSRDFPNIIYTKTKRKTVTLAHRDCYFKEIKK